MIGRRGLEMCHQERQRRWELLKRRECEGSAWDHRHRRQRLCDRMGLRSRGALTL